MWRVDGASSAPAGFEDVALPLAASDDTRGAGFAQTFNSLQRDIAATIEQGFAASESPALSAEARAWRQRFDAAPLNSAGVNGAMSEAQQSFMQAVSPWAAQAGAQLGVAPELVAAHAALESGWGQRPLKKADGANSYNLFGVKAGAGWQGAVSDALTTEHVGGADVKKVERFRAYPDLQSAFADYTQLLQRNPRFAGALGTGGDVQAFAQALARGGYATDPAYADKLARVAAQLKGKW